MTSDADIGDLRS